MLVLFSSGGSVIIVLFVLKAVLISFGLVLETDFICSWLVLRAVPIIYNSCLYVLVSRGGICCWFWLDFGTVFAISISCRLVWDAMLASYRFCFLVFL